MPQISPNNWNFIIGMLILLTLSLKELITASSVKSPATKMIKKTMKPLKW